MIPASPIRTERLELIPATLEMLASENGDRRVLARLLNAAIPPSWPPPLLDEETLAGFVRMKVEGSDPVFCVWYWILINRDSGDRTLIGSGGTGSCSGDEGAVMIGYSVLSEFQNRGYATEALRHLIPAIFSYPGIRRIFATTYPELKASIRILEKNGFVPAGAIFEGQGMEEGTVVYVRDAVSPQ
jgi:RimJ/RimL family protein N-acetyltransferase